MKKIILSLLTVCLFSTTDATNITSGLHLNSHLYKPKERTSLALENGESITLKNKTELDFEMLIRPEDVAFGSVFRLVTDNKENFDLVFSPSLGAESTPAFIINEKTYPLKGGIVESRWFSVHLTLSRKDKTIKLRYGEVNASFPHSFDHTKSFIVQFGVCHYANFFSADPASVNIRNVKILQNDRLFRYWKLGKNNGNVCYDEINGTPALVENPHWLIDDHTRWKQVYTTQTKKSPQYTFDKKRGLIYIVEDNKKITAFNIRTNKDSIIPVLNGFLAGENNSQLVFDTQNDRLVSYNLTEKRLSYYDSKKSAWSCQTSSDDESKYWDHTATYYAKDTSLITFGGYGFFKYNNTLFHINLNNAHFTDKKLPEIYPRYTPASTIIDDQLYIFGGRGSKQGRQELSQQNFYDLYRIDLRTDIVTKIWENKGEQYVYMPGSNMVYDSPAKCFYVLTNDNGGRMARINLKDTTSEFIGETIGENLQANYFYETLYYSPDLSKFFAVMTFQNETSGKVKIFEMCYPPLNIAETLQKPPKKSMLPFITILACIALIVTGYYWIRREKHKKDKRAILEKITPPSINPLPVEKTTTLPHHFDRSKSCISLLGSFNVKDKFGNDITDKFSPTLKNLLILLIMFTEKDTKGITGDNINKVLWRDKYEASAKNNRNVSIRKLRILLESVGDIEIRTSNYWGINYGENILCDYHQVMVYIRNQNSNETNDNTSFDKLIELILFGPLLPDFALDWLDSFKSDLSTLVIDYLKDLSSRISETDVRNRLRIADAILSHDSLNVEAIRIKCNALCYSEKKGIAKNAYDNFCKEYLALMGERFNRSFSELIDNK